MSARGSRPFALEAAPGQGGMFVMTLAVILALTAGAVPTAAAAVPAPGGAAAGPTAGAAAEGGNPDLAACLAAARAHAPRLAELQALQDEAVALAAETSAQRRPSLGLGGTYRYTSQTMESELSLGPGLPAKTLTFGDGHAADLKLGLALPLYTGGELGRTFDAATAGAKAAGWRSAAATLDLDLKVRRAFFAALGRQARCDAAGLAEARLGRHLEQIEGAIAAGTAAEEARLRAVARLWQAQERRIQAEAARDSAGIVLGVLLGHPATVVLPAGDLQAPLIRTEDPAPGEPDGLQGLEGRPEVQAIEQERARQDFLADAARGRLRPRLVGDVALHYGRPGVDQLANDWMGYATAGLSLEWSLWDGGGRSQRVAQARARARQAESRLQDAAESIHSAHAVAVRDLDAARRETASVEERAVITRRLLEFVKMRYEQADATQSEYLDAEDDLAAVEFELALARTRLRLCEAVLLRTLGR